MPKGSSLFSSRSGVELAVNTIVIMIIGIVILGAGIALVWQVVSGGEELSGSINDQQRNQLRSLMNSGKLVALYPSSVDVTAGDKVVVGLAIQNRLGQAEEFSIDVKIYDPNAVVAADSSTNPPWFAYNPPGVVPERGDAEIALVVRPSPDAAQGPHTLLVTVIDSDGNVYDSARSANINVR